VKALAAVLKIVGFALACCLALALAPFWALGFALQGAWSTFQHGRSSFLTLDNKLGKK
jgi:hypothetical protein